MSRHSSLTLEIRHVTSSLGTFFEAGMLPKVTASDPAGMDSLSLWLMEPNTMGDPILETENLKTPVSHDSDHMWTRIDMRA
jgi:hypothetical protein